MLVINEEVINKIGYTIEPNLAALSRNQQNTFQWIIADITKKRREHVLRRKNHLSWTHNNTTSNRNRS